ncbi:PaaI family thioesterase [Pseudonocardia sp. EV170527-09]|uniref:PaaI family thioesterase n=1 Tax=Pseudonocardia sp. EV170527-09 TaxID=2603411 RepID=UPI001F02F818|nr:hotdog fold thioesterase [Pseudonocardia sp. EV170527-09]
MPITPDQLPELSSEYALEQLNDRMGIEILVAGLDEVVGRMPVAGNRQPYGLLHGGASGVLAETLGSTLSAMHALPERFPVGLELACTHHRSATSGWVTGTARPVHIGRSTSTSEIVLVDDEGRRVCTAKLTCLHRDTRPPAGSATPRTS